MKHAQHHLEDKLDAYLDGELSRKEARSARKHLKMCDFCREQLREKRELSQRIRSLTVQQCPDRIVEFVVRETSAKKPSVRIRREGVSWRFAAVAATVATVALFLAVWPIIRTTPPNSQYEYSAAEIAQAKSDVERALIYVNEALTRTQKTLEQEVMPERVIKPLKMSIQEIFGVTANNGG